jgi:hypothetical protein
MQNPVVSYPVSLEEIDERITHAVVTAINPVFLQSGKVNNLTGNQRHHNSCISEPVIIYNDTACPQY